MSNVLYPLGAIENLDVRLLDRTIKDEFEDGSQSSRRLWSQYYFKRRFSVQHAALTETEFEYLRGFFVARSGQYDSFWFRDNVHRGGNASVRLAEAFQINRQGQVYRPRLVLEEVAPLRMLVTLAEVQVATTPWAWYDANIQRAYLHQGTEYFDGTVKDSTGNALDLTWNSASVVPIDTYQSAQYQSFIAGAGQWAKRTGVTIGANTANGLFAILKGGTASAARVLFGWGNAAAGEARGIQIGSDNKFKPWLGGTETYSNAVYTNSAADTWRSFGIIFNYPGDTVELYVNGVSVGTDSKTVKTASSGTTIWLGSGPAEETDPFDCKVAQAIALSGGLSTGPEIIALHNLFAHQYGLTAV
jgi:hypothetical protein